MNIGIEILADNKKNTPQQRSIQLPISLNIPTKDFAMRIIPKTISRKKGNFTPAPNIRIIPANTSIAPKILTSMFFKPKNDLKMCLSPSNSAWIECVPPKDEVVGSNPTSGA